MSRRPGLLVGVILVLAGSAIPTASAADANAAPTPPLLRLLYLLPEGFRGWACVDFGVAGAPPLPREGDTRIIQPRLGQILKTSEKAPLIPPIGEACPTSRLELIWLPFGFP